MNNTDIYNKFGDIYSADENTFKMGIDHRITNSLAKRFENKLVLETCTGGGFTTIALAKSAAKVITIEIDKTNQNQAISNIKKAGFSKVVEFINGSCLNEKILDSIISIDAAFLDPDWADTEIDHVYKFTDSNTKPPADILLERILKITPNIALVLPPYIPAREFDPLPPHEFQKIYLENELALFCLYFGNLSKENGSTELYI